MTLFTVPTWGKKYHGVIAGTAIGAHFFALIVLMLASVPKGYNSFDDAHGSLISIVGAIAYLVHFMNDRAEARRFAIGVVLGAWLALIAPDLEHRVGGAIGLALLGLGVWAAEISRQLDSERRSVTW